MVSAHGSHSAHTPHCTVHYLPLRHVHCACYRCVQGGTCQNFDFLVAYEPATVQTTDMFGTTIWEMFHEFDHLEAWDHCLAKYPEMVRPLSVGEQTANVNSILVNTLVGFTRCAFVERLLDDGHPVNLTAKPRGGIRVLMFLMRMQLRLKKQPTELARLIGNFPLSPLHAAVVFSKPRETKLLIERKADVNSRVHRRRKTPLHLAAAAGDPSIVELLLQAGADAHAKDGRGRVPAHYAHKEGFDDLAARLGGTGVAKGGSANKYRYKAATVAPADKVAVGDES